MSSHPGKPKLLKQLQSCEVSIGTILWHKLGYERRAGSHYLLCCEASFEPETCKKSLKMKVTNVRSPL